MCYLKVAAKIWFTLDNPKIYVTVGEILENMLLVFSHINQVN